MRHFFYAVGDERQGPLSETALLELFQLRTVTPETLVWSEGMTGWERLDAVFPQWITVDGTATCAVSGRVLPKSEMIKFGDEYVSPESRDVYIQRLQQGLPTKDLDFNPAGMWRRLGAFFLDGIIIAVVPMAAVVVFAIAASGANPDAEITDGQAQLVALGMLLMLLAYETIMLGAWGATLGKIICGLQVVRWDGSRPGYGQALGRAAIKHVLGYFCSGIINLISLIKAARDQPWHHSLHDEATKTRVVMRRR